MLSFRITTTRILFGGMPYMSLCRVETVAAIVVVVNIMPMCPAVVPVVVAFVWIARSGLTVLSHGC